MVTDPSYQDLRILEDVLCFRRGENRIPEAGSEGKEV
jgi:hypothetical protein